MGPMPLPELPAIPGREVAGMVDAVGEDVDERGSAAASSRTSDPASRGYAELAVREVERLHVLPDGVADDVAVAMIGTGRTAMAILDVAAHRAPATSCSSPPRRAGSARCSSRPRAHAGARVIGAAGARQAA